MKSVFSEQETLWQVFLPIRKKEKILCLRCAWINFVLLCNQKKGFCLFEFLNWSEIREVRT